MAMPRTREALEDNGPWVPRKTRVDTKMRTLGICVGAKQAKQSASLHGACRRRPKAQVTVDVTVRTAVCCASSSATPFGRQQRHTLLSTSSRCVERVVVRLPGRLATGSSERIIAEHTAATRYQQRPPCSYVRTAFFSRPL